MAIKIYVATFLLQWKDVPWHLLKTHVEKHQYPVKSDNGYQQMPYSIY